MKIWMMAEVEFKRRCLYSSFFISGKDVELSGGVSPVEVEVERTGSEVKKREKLNAKLSFASVTKESCKSKCLIELGNKEHQK